MHIFVRKKNNKSGSVSVVVVSKARGKFREVQKIGVSSDIEEIECLYRQGQSWIRAQMGLLDMFAQSSKENVEREAVDYFFNNIANLRTIPGVSNISAMIISVSKKTI